MSLLKNYTCGVAVDTTLARIERLLVDAGAVGIAKEYGAGGRVKSLVFQIPFEKGGPLAMVKLPANVDACLEVFWKDHCRTRSVHSRKQSEDFRDQAERTAWKLQQDWVQVQLSLIKLNQQDAMQAFLPYAWNGNQTVYDRVKAGGFKALGLPSSTRDEGHDPK